MKKLWDLIVTAAIALLFASMIFLGLWWDLHVWQLQHPGAPLWTWFFK